MYKSRIGQQKNRQKNKRLKNYFGNPQNKKKT